MTSSFFHFLVMATMKARRFSALLCFCPPAVIVFGYLPTPNDPDDVPD